MTNGILKSINTKYIMYKIMVQASTTNHDPVKANFNTYKNILQQNIREENKFYSNKTFLLNKNHIKKTGPLLKKH